MMKEKVIKGIAAAVGIIGFLLMLGSVGAMETDGVTFAHGAVQLVAGLTMFIGGTLVTIGG